MISPWSLVDGPAGRLDRFRTLRPGDRLATPLLVLLGVTLSVVHLQHVRSHEEITPIVFIGGVVPLVISLAVVVVAVGLQASARIPPRRVWWWTYGGAATMGAVASLVVFDQGVVIGSVRETQYVLATVAAGGALGGTLVGIYDAQRVRRLHRIETIHRVTEELLTVHTREDVCGRVVETVAEEFDMPHAGIWLHDADRDALVPASLTEASLDLFGEDPVYSAGPDPSISWEVFESGTPRVVDDVDEYPRIYDPTETPVRSEVLLPLGDHGVFSVAARQRRAFDDVDVTIARILASTTTAALDRAAREETIQRHREELERRSAQLEEFAGTVSHDLRNPLNVATGYLELARETGDDEYFDRIEDALSRMDRLIGDVLTLAREGEGIDETKPVDLGAVARDAWGFVETSDAELVVDANRTVEADPNRLQQALENLYHNAVEHAGPDVTVRVETIADGFAVADDGPGIPAGDREAVFEAGHSSDPDGTGYGLAIVETIAEAHGWDVRCGAGADGGARFEFHTE
ncbi:Signal transduction histidine kinase [Halopenitus malekzadehii]|uniref:histidine kinase n=1 Tax=Halopenitus malekzadehii TaxID=1267564 RepID=A0A1H6JWJ5_9EURY|nr:Signal transduction histidine kinase [Halopenitus malekzadehii]